MKLRTLGTLALDGTDFRKHKSLLLLVYLALEGPQERTHLARVFWPEASQPSQRLRSTLDLLRSGAPGAAERVGSKITTPIPCDAANLQVALEDGNLERCIALYEGPFLEGLAVGRLGLELEEWVFATRERLAEYVRHGLLRLAERSRSDPKRAAYYVRQAYLLDGAALPSSTQLRQILKALHAAGDPLVATIERDVGDTPLSTDESLDLDGDEAWTLESAASRHNLTTPPTALLGRGALLIDLERRVASPDVRLLNLTGMGGVGKTRLAVELAWRLLSFYDAVYFVPLATYRDPNEVLGAIADTLELKPVVGRPLQELLVAGLEGQDILLILDNFEHVVEAAAEVADLLARCPRLTVIVTSRSTLRLRGEHEVVVPSLPTPPATYLDARPENLDLREYASIALFCARTAEVSGNADVIPIDLASVAGICRRLDGLPLALELAASRTKFLSPAEILERLDRSLDLLAQGALDLPERHRSLRGTMLWSYELLSDDEKRLFRYLGVAPGGCDLALATVLCQDATIIPEIVEDEETRVLNLLSSLLDKSLIVRATGTRGALRVTMLETVRRFAAETLASHPSELRSRLERMFGHLSNLLSGLREPIYNADTGVIAKVSIELGNIRVAWFWALSEGRPAHVLQVFMFNFFTAAGRYQDGIRLFTEAIQLLGESGDEVSKGRLYGSLAWFYYRLGDTDGAKNAAEESVVALRRLNGSEVLGVALETYAGILYGMGDYKNAHVAYSEAYGLYKSLNKVGEHLSVLDALGLVASAKGDYIKALELFEQVHKVAKGKNAAWTRTETLSYIAEVHRLRGDLEASRLAAEESYALSHATSETYSQLVAAYQLGLTTLVSRDVTRAETLFSEALQAALSANVPEFVARAQLGFAQIAAMRGLTSHIGEHLLEALLAVKNTGLRPVLLSCALMVSELSSFVDLQEQAVALLQAVRDDPATRAHERHKAAVLIGEVKAEADFSTSLAATSSLPLLIEQVVKCLSKEPSHNPWSKSDP